MTLSIKPVDINYTNQIWPQVKNYLQDALTNGIDFPDWAACYDINHVQQYVTSGQWLLLIAINEKAEVLGACTVSFSNYPLHRVAFVSCIGGKLISSRETFEQLKQILRGYGATKIQGSGRPAIVRLLKRYNFEPRNTIIEALL